MLSKIMKFVANTLSKTASCVPMAIGLLFIYKLPGFRQTD